MQNLVRPSSARPAESQKQQVAAALSVIALGLVAVCFVVSTAGTGDDAEDAISNVLTPYQRQALAQARTSQLIMGPGQEDTDAKAIKAAYATFKDSKDKEVEEELEVFNPEKLEEEVEEAVEDMKALGDETKAEAKILKKFALPDGR